MNTIQNFLIFQIRNQNYLLWSRKIFSYFTFTASAGNGVLLDNIAAYDLAANEGAETPVPFTLTDEHAEKLAGVLFDAVSTYLDGDLDGALATARDFFVEVDGDNNLRVAVWAGEAQTGETISALVETAGGIVTNTYDEFVIAFVPFDGIISPYSSKYL